MRVPIDGIAEFTTLSVLLSLVFTPPTAAQINLPKQKKSASKTMEDLYTQSPWA